MTESEALIYEFSDYTVDSRQRTVRFSKAAEPLALGGRAFDALLVLLESRGQLVTKAVLMKRLWPDVIVEDGNLSQAIYALRQALGETPGEHRFIATVTGRGYRFVAPVRVRSSPGTEHLPASVAVLPFVNLTGDIAKDYWGEGIAEELIVSLGRVAGLRVPARTSSFAYKGRLVDVRQIGKDLGVTIVVEGSVRSAGDRIRVSAHVNETRSGYRIWSDSYDRHFTDLFELQDELANSIREVLIKQLNLDLPEAAHPRARAVDVEAYRLYMQGLHLLDRMSVPNTDQAVACFRNALARDPGFARGHEALATGLLGYNPLGCQTFERLAECREAAERALGLDPTLSDAHDSVGAVAFFAGEWKEARSHMDIALRLGAHDAMVHWHYAMWLVQLGQLRSAITHAERAYALAPASASSAIILAYVKSLIGDDAEAIRLANVAADLGIPRHARPLAVVYEAVARRQGRIADAAAALLGGVSPENPDQRLFGEAVRLVYPAVESGKENRQAAQSVLSLYEEEELASRGLNIDGFIWAMASAESLILLDARDECFELCRRIADAMAPRRALVFLRPTSIWSIECREFRRDTRFSALASHLGWMEAWKHFGPPDGAEIIDGRVRWPEAGSSMPE